MIAMEALLYPGAILGPAEREWADQRKRPHQGWCNKRGSTVLMVSFFFLNCFESLPAPQLIWASIWRETAQWPVQFNDSISLWRFNASNQSHSVIGGHPGVVIMEGGRQWMLLQEDMPSLYVLGICRYKKKNSCIFWISFPDLRAEDLRSWEP